MPILPKEFRCRNNFAVVRLSIPTAVTREVFISFGVAYDDSGPNILSPGWKGSHTRDTDDDDIMDTMPAIQDERGIYTSGWVDSFIDAITEAKRYLVTSGYFCSQEIPITIDGRTTTITEWYLLPGIDPGTE